MESEADEKQAVHRRKRRWPLITLGVVLVVVLAAVVITSITPWPSAMLIRSVFEQGGRATAAAASTCR